VQTVEQKILRVAASLVHCCVIKKNVHCCVITKNITVV